MVKKAVIAAVVIIAAVIVAAGAYVALSGNGKDPNDVTFLIQDDKGVYFWAEGNGETALDALEDALSDYPDGTIVKSSNGGVTIFDLSSSQDSKGNWIWWIQFTWEDDRWIFNMKGLDSIMSKDVDYELILFGSGNMDDPEATEVPQGTPVPKDKAVWDGSTNGTVFTIQSESGLYFKINGTGGDTLLETFGNACGKYKVQVETAESSMGKYLVGIFGIGSSQDSAGNWMYWAEYEYKSGAWESSNMGMDGLKSSDNPQYALMFGDGSGVPA
ncbi:MAG: hypothetical protein LBJ20_07905 [Candidatus Methanoplasma sp.]|jgi:hypothetical protein|nr:hypothetical protein [Candidatus Methanoplasma sp.]